VPDQPPVQRRLAAILAADVVGFSKLIGEDEAETLAALREIRKGIVNPAMTAHGGRVFKVMSDGLLAEFPSAVQALQAAIGIQEALDQHNTGLPLGPQIKVRIGVHQGDVVVEGTDLLGDGVNIAARLEALAEPGAICISGRVHEDAGGKIKIKATDLGERQLKNIERPIRIYSVAVGDAPSFGATKADAERPALPLPDRPSLAVLPFQNMSGDPEQEYFADGMVEEIITALSRVRSFFVIARNTSFTYKGKAVDVKQVGRELGVRYVLEGSIRKAANRVRITCQLIEASSNRQVWADRFEGALDDIFELQDRITESVAGAIQPSILVAEIERIKRERPESLDAYDCVLRALPHVWALDRTANSLALKHLTRAVEIEPNYPLALSMSAWCRAQQRIYGWAADSREARAETLRLAKSAGDMSSDDPMVLTMLCAAHSVIGDLDVASALIEKALALNSNSALAWARSGVLKVYLDQPELAIEHFQRAMRLSPFDPMNFNVHFGMGMANFGAARYEDSLRCWKKGLLERPDLDWPLRSVAACLGVLGRISEAHEVVRQVLQAAPDMTVSKHVAIMPHRGDYPQRIAEGLRKAGLPE
jgi:adenylate cyclase